MYRGACCSGSALQRLAFVGERAMGALSFEPALENELPAHEITLLEVAGQIDHFTAGTGAAVLNELVFIGGSPQGARP